MSSSSVSHAISTPHTPPPHVRLLNDAEFAQKGVEWPALFFPLVVAASGPAEQRNTELIVDSASALSLTKPACLLNVDYVMWLASEGYFEDEAFLNYLKYLEYLREAPYFHLLVYPSSMDMIRILRCPSVRQQLLKEPAAARAVLQEQLWCSWGLRNEEEELKEGDEQVDEEMLKSGIVDGEK
ncbi:Mediator of RNA polymerase II transcription subunit 31 [Perkinsus olseni]|uniref:Mediator of RNA polymerase II transcription subunit 31 n=1 Tax=Perkinsus olseni TaxID=32597 RepID=A0A7J6LWQ2_PEROL|nr:Mediator of RNA polymerase II transcription subunit 31 [Perkinsus olseni]KAF4669904.1 Mediator of RNA polymerase II transcription subunit 31 [Perkinsus olseni]